MKRNICMVILVIMLLFSLVACGSKSYNDYDYGYNDGVNSSVSQKGSYSDSDSISGRDNYEYEEPSEQKGNNEDNSSTQDYLSTQKLIYTCRVSLETLEFDKAIGQLKDLIKNNGGFIESDETIDNESDWYYSGYYKSTGTKRETIVVRVPTTNYNDFVNGVTGIGKVLTKNENVDNITKQYNDVETTIESLKIQEARLLEMMKVASTIDEMITVETRLSQVQRQLESYQSNLNHMDMDIQFSTVTISVREVMEYSPEIVEPTFGERLGKAISESAQGFVSFCQNFLIVFIYAFPFLVVMGTIALITVLIVKGAIKHKKKRVGYPQGRPFTVTVPQSTAPLNQNSSEQTPIKEQQDSSNENK